MQLGEEVASMGTVQAWTGSEATALRLALRLTVEGFAAELGIAPRTVAAWGSHGGIVPRPVIQAALDSLLERAALSVRERFSAATGSQRDGKPQLLRVSIAIVEHDGAVLLTCRRDSRTSGIGYGFPAGVVKPGDDPEDVAVRETLAETGVHVMVLENIGARIHPVTGVYCAYYFCGYLGGEARNCDVAENVSVTWAPIANLAGFIPRDLIYPAVLGTLEGTRERAVR